MKKKILKSFLVILLLISITGCGKSKNETDDNSYESDNSSSTNTKEEVKELTESEKMIVKISSLIDEGLAFDAGDYIKDDIPAGEYAFVKFEGSGSYYCEKDAAGNIVDNENFDSFGYVKVHSVGNLETSGVLINISAFEKLDVTGAKQLYEILNNQENYNQGGYYKVGTDLEAGQYLLESIGSGYWAIMTGPVGNSDIVDNDNFNGRASVNLKSGQYITLSNAKITKQ